MEIDHKCIWCLHFVYSFYISFFTINHNNVAVKIVACWNRNVFTSSSLLWHWELVFTIHLRCDPPHSYSPVRSSILCVRVYIYRPADLVSSIKVNLFDMFPCCCCSAMEWTRCCLGFGKNTVGNARDGDWRRWLSSSAVTFNICRLCVHFTVDWLFWNL